jgi:hypothetical protein
MLVRRVGGRVGDRVGGRVGGVTKIKYLGKKSIYFLFLENKSKKLK